MLSKVMIVGAGTGGLCLAQGQARQIRSPTRELISSFWLSGKTPTPIPILTEAKAEYAKL
jgi:hypothetical protein